MDKEAIPTEETQEETQVKKPVNTNRRKKILIALLILLLMAAAGGGAWWWRDKTAKKVEKQQATDISSLQQTTASLKKQLAAAKAKSAAGTGQTACIIKAPGASATSNIEASITSGNTAALEGYMAPSVNVIIAASEGLGAKTPAQAVASITDFITPDTNSWNYDFSLPASVLSSYGKGSYAQYFPAYAIVGKAPNNKVISFSFDCNAKISTVFMAADESLLQ